MPDLWQHFKRFERLLQSFRQDCEQLLDFVPRQGISVWMDGWMDGKFSLCFIGIISDLK